MTNDEAINTLKNTAWLGSEEQAEKVSEAVRMAVEALKRETSGDAISRHDAIDALMEILDRPNHAEFLYTDEICKALNELPSAQPEIIRCKDCKHWIPYDWMFSEVWRSKNIADYPEDEIGCNYCDMAMKANDFCSRVERRTK